MFFFATTKTIHVKKQRTQEKKLATSDFGEFSNWLFNSFPLIDICPLFCMSCHASAKMGQYIVDFMNNSIGTPIFKNICPTTTNC
jgi:hypothetical protein